MDKTHLSAHLKRLKGRLQVIKSKLNGKRQDKLRGIENYLVGSAILKAKKLID